MFGCIRGELSIAETVEAGVSGADPQRACAVFEDRPDGVARQAVVSGVVSEPAVGKTAETAGIRAQPEGVLFVEENGFDVVVPQAVVFCIGGEFAVLKAG